MTIAIRHLPFAISGALSITVSLGLAGCERPATDAKKTPDVKVPADPKPAPAEADDKKKEPKPDSDLPPGLELNPPEVAPGYPAGYLAKADVPDGMKLLPPPPAAKSTALAHDEAMSKVAFGLKGKPRWTQAIADASMEMPSLTASFSCALGTPINATDTPHLYRLIARILMDAAAINSGVKEHYKRERPFMVHKEEPCADKDLLLADGSYPSGHTTFGMAVALVLSELAPERTEALVQRGRAFGESRMVCNAHWQSDVVQGRYTGGVLAARLHTSAAFRADHEMARRDIAAVRAKNLPPSVDCAVEAAALADPLPGAL